MYKCFFIIAIGLFVIVDKSYENNTSLFKSIIMG